MGNPDFCCRRREYPNTGSTPIPVRNQDSTDNLHQVKGPRAYTHQSIFQHLVDQGAADVVADHDAAGWHPDQVAAPVLGDRRPRPVAAQQLVVGGALSVSPDVPVT